jgi:hypothetical protein
VDGVFNLGEDYYEKSGGRLEASDHYLQLVMRPFEKK